MSAITKPCRNCNGKGSYGHELLGVNQCHACSGTGRAPDVEATLRAENETLRRQLDALAGGQADGVLALARTLADAETTTLRAEIDAARADMATLRDSATEDIARLANENDRLRSIIRHNAPVAVGVCSPMVNVELDKRDAEIARLTAEVDRMTALYRYADDGHDENMRETARLTGEVERLTTELGRASLVTHATEQWRLHNKAAAVNATMPRVAAQLLARAEMCRAILAGETP